MAWGTTIPPTSAASIGWWSQPPAPAPIDHDAGWFAADLPPATQGFPYRFPFRFGGQDRGFPFTFPIRL